MKRKNTILIAILSLMVLAFSFNSLAAQMGQVISGGTVILERPSESSNKLTVEGDTEAHVDADLTLKLYLDYKSSLNGTVTTVKTWNYSKDADTLLTKSTSYTGADGYYRLRGFHSAYLSGYGTETLTSETDWIEVK